MDAFNVRLTTSARKDVRKLKQQLLERVAARLQALALNPFPPQAEKLSQRDEYRLRVGDYRIVYEVDKRGRIVTIHRIRHRREVYRKL